MPATEVDHEALRLIRRRDPRGFDQLYLAYAARLHRFLLRLCGERELAADLVQTAFMRLAEVGPELRPDSDVRAWLFSVARNAFVSSLRQRRTQSETELEAVSSLPPEVEARLELGEVERALARLRLEDRELLLLIAVEGFEPHAVAELLGIEQAALRQRLARARARLSALLNDATATTRERRLP